MDDLRYDIFRSDYERAVLLTNRNVCVTHTRGVAELERLFFLFQVCWSELCDVVGS